MSHPAAARWLLGTLALCLWACAPDPEARRKGLPITPAERALAQAVWDLDIAKAEPIDASSVGGTGLDLGPWLDEREQRAALATLIASSDAERLAGLTASLQRERQVVQLSALLDHPSLRVRRAAVQALKNLRERRGVIALLAAAKHNAFDLDAAPAPAAPPSAASAPSSPGAIAETQPAPGSQPASAPALDDQTRRAAQLGYRKELAAALQHITRVKPYEGPAQRQGGPPRIWAFDFGRLDLWLENEVLRARRWSE